MFGPATFFLLFAALYKMVAYLLKTINLKIMKFNHFYTTITFFCLLSISCSKMEELETTPVFLQLNEKGLKLVKSSSNFGIDLFKESVKAEKQHKNQMISPFSVSMALAMAYNGANGETKTAIENTLRLNGLTTDEINLNFKQISEALLEVDPTVTLSIANSIWYRQEFMVLQPFKDVNTEFYRAQITPLDFNAPNAKDIINNWVSLKTNNKIPTIIEQIEANTVMFLINALYFKGPWKYRFDKAANYMGSFYLSDGSSKQVEMMQQKAKLSSYGNNLMSMIELPYGRGNWVMNLLLPNEGKTLDDILAQLSASTWETWVSSLSTPNDIQIAFPAFKFEYNQSLKDVLSVMGMEIAFDPNNADFSKINNLEQLFISSAKHKTFVEVNEEGTEAAAVTSIGIGVTSIGSAVVFNRPFLFVIREQTSGTILFIGKVENPVR
jgi:serine protease inhibitor